MSDEKKQDSDTDDDVYVIDDTGESLEDFKPEEIAGLEAVPPGSKTMGDEALRKENQTLRDQVLRSRADFDNFRKRSEKEKADYFKYALASSVRELLPVLDNFERALSIDVVGSDFKTGVEMIYKQMADALQKLGLREVEAQDAEFDPTLHEAVMREETDQVPSHTVMQVLQKGYTLNDRLIRPAMVKVSVGGPDRVTDSEGKG